MTKRIVFLIIMVGALFLLSCAKTEAPSPPSTPTPPKPETVTPTPPPAAPTTPATVAVDASKVFSTNCAACHGANRQGTPGLAPALTPQSLVAKSEAEIAETILKGKTGTAMMAWEGRLSQDEVKALATFLKNTAP